LESSIQSDFTEEEQRILNSSESLNNSNLNNSTLNQTEEEEEEEEEEQGEEKEVFSFNSTTPSVVNITSNCQIDPADVTEDVCIREGCENLAVRNPEWEGEYCSNECVVQHCKNVFDAYTTQTMAEHLAQVAGWHRKNRH